MNRIVAALALAFSLSSLSAVAVAAPPKDVAAKHQKGEKGKGKRDGKQFPMKADEYKKHIAERTAKAREMLEKHISKKNAGADKAKEMREKFNATVARVNKKVDEVTADGTVSKEEAKEVRDIFQEARGHHGKKHGKKKLAPPPGPHGTRRRPRARGRVNATLRGHAPAPPPRLPPV